MSLFRKLFSVDFEVFGKVQGVYFRKFTQEKATNLGLVGWCMNTDQGTVRGVMQGTRERIDEMKEWLQKTGSPMSSIDRAVFTNEKEIQEAEFGQFGIRR